MAEISEWCLLNNKGRIVRYGEKREERRAKERHKDVSVWQRLLGLRHTCYSMPCRCYVNVCLIALVCNTLVLQSKQQNTGFQMTQICRIWSDFTTSGRTSVDSAWLNCIKCSSQIKSPDSKLHVFLNYVSTPTLCLCATYITMKLLPTLLQK